MWRKTGKCIHPKDLVVWWPFGVRTAGDRPMGDKSRGGRCGRVSFGSDSLKVQNEDHDELEVILMTKEASMVDLTSRSRRVAST
jgi:hypothetical protein